MKITNPGKYKVLGDFSREEVGALGEHSISSLWQAGETLFVNTVDNARKLVLINERWYDQNMPVGPWGKPDPRSDLALPWYPVPPYRNEGWQILNRNGELVATFENRSECETVCHLTNRHIGDIDDE